MHLMILNLSAKQLPMDKFHFNLKAGNGQIIGSSQMYASEAGMENGIDSVKNNAPDAEVKEVAAE